MRTYARAVVLTAVTALAVGGLAAPALADSPALSTADPDQNESLNVDPDGVTLTFDQPLSVVSTIAVTGPSGECLKTSPVLLESTELSCAFVSGDLADGTYTVSYTAVPSSGPDPATTDSYVFVLDSVAPVAPTDVAIAPDPYNATSTTLTVTGTSESEDDTVEVLVSDGTTTLPQIVDADSGGAFTATFDASEVAGLADGTLTATARSTDAAGNQGPVGSDTATKDTGAPAAPTVDALPLFANQANSASFPVSGTGEPGASVAVTVNGTSGSATASATVAGSGMWSTAVDVTGLPDGTLTVTATQTDSAGNTGSTSSAQEATKDTEAPGTPTVLVSPDPVNAANQATVTVSGDSDGAGVTITVGDGAGGGVDLTQTATVSGGGYSLIFDVSSLDDGTITAAVVATDAAGNTSPAGTDTATKDVVSPTAPTVDTVPPFASLANSAAFPVSGTGEPGASVLVTVTGSSGSATGSATVGLDGTWNTAVNVAGLPDGTLTVTATQADVAGNTSPASAARTTTKDTGDPASPTVNTVPPFANQANSAAFPVSGTGEPGAWVAVTVNGTSGSATASATVASNGTWGTTVDVTGLPDGTLTVTVTQADVAGNTSPTSVPQSTTKDTGAPGAPTVNALPPFANQANSAVFPVSGTGEPGASVTVTVTRASASVTKNVTVSVGGSWSTTVDVTGLSDGTLTVTATQTDAATNTSPASAPRTTTKDTGIPAVPSVNTLPPFANQANSAVFPVSGTGEPGASVTVTVTRASASVTKNVTVPVGGSWSTTVNVTGLSDGTLTVTTTQTDVAGNTSPTSVAQTTTKDTVPPPEPSSVQISPDPINAANQAAVTVSGQAEGARVRITVSRGANSVTQTVDVSGGGYSAVFDVSSLADGGIAALVVAFDAAGNIGDPEVDQTLKDTVVPTKTSSTPVEGSRVLPPATVTVTFSETLATGSIAIPGVAGTSSRSGSTITFTPAATMPEGTLTATAAVTDLRGNPGSGTVTFIVDDGFATTSTTLDPIPAAVSYQKTIKLSGQVTRPDKSVPALPVMVLMRDDAGRTREVALVTPSASGAWSYSYRPTVNGTYSATYLGDRKNAASTSVDRTTKVRVGIAASAATGPATKKATVKGNVTPAKVGAIVQLHRVGKGGTKLLGTAKVKGGGRFTFRIRLPRGKTTLQVSIGSTPGNMGGSARLTAFRT